MRRSQLLQKTLKLLVGDPSQLDFLKVPKNRPLKKLSERELITLESEVGAQLFGTIPKGRRREFFCLDATTWIWYEEWIDEKRKTQSSTVRYEVGEKGILKVQEGARYSYLEGKELQDFALATRLYYEQVARNVYRIDPATGRRLA
ncbi:MAG: hypothetical protein WAQ22_00525 [Candidatus Saccharimonas sp.]